MTRRHKLHRGWLGGLGVIVLLVVGMAAMWWRDVGSAVPISAHQFSARWMGDGTILLDDGASAILIDPYFSRLSRERLRQRTIEPDTGRIEAALRRVGAPRLLAVLATHSAFDHAMDIPIVAARMNADVAGSRSTQNIARGLAFPEDRIRTFENGEFLAYADFNIMAVAAPTSASIGDSLAGDIDVPLRPPVSPLAYRTGRSYSLIVEHDGRRVLVVGRPTYEPGSMLGIDADVVFLSIDGLAAKGERFAADYWREIVATTGASLVVLTQWDDHSRPLEQAMRPLSKGDYDTAIDWMQQLGAHDGITVRVPKEFERIDLMAPSLADVNQLQRPRDVPRHVRQRALVRDERIAHRYPQGPIRRQTMRGIL
jgi:L-ascorbate metabolism protein UlaG (beta-lactamase superfamily)